ncbi:Hint domain-containing protein [Aliishimia ponticola]|uniref:Hint domain-containing protein n=1 Tax=Aliishimia ponticola TaxID=2499833 RepID=A0A4S4NH17_9RHOB|nr:Hint domain-containing protein [Aliishimia ponticola]THH38964.1 Hint domain-containing protein [Aliishimia ponticola]
MSPHSAPLQSLAVIDGRAFKVVRGANLGDGLSFADDLVLDDIYQLSETALRPRMSLTSEGGHFRIAEGSEAGQIGARVCLDCALTLMSEDGETTDAIVMVELDGNDYVAASYLLPLAPISPKMDYALVGIDISDAREMLARIACVSFSRGTQITLSSGLQRPIEDLQPGDKVLTRDAGAQEIRWIGQNTLRATGQFAPIRIKAGTLNNDRDLIVSPDHRLFIYQREDRIGAGRSELLVKARHLVNGDSVVVMEGGYIDYFQLLFDDHQIIFAEGIAAESFLVDLRTAPAVPIELSSRMSSTPGNRMARLDVNEGLLDRPDAAELLRLASSR